MVLTESNYKLSKGDKAPDFNLLATDGKTYSLKDLPKKKAYLIIFMCNHCPYVQAKFDELNRIAQDYGDLRVIGINSNEDVDHPEDSYEKMNEYVKAGKIKYTYFRDDTQEVAKAYGAVCTPDPFLFDSDFNLVFHSRIDDPPGTGPVLEHEMHKAIGEFLKKGKISMSESPSIGCNIKWK